MPGRYIACVTFLYQKKINVELFSQKPVLLTCARVFTIRIARMPILEPRGVPPRAAALPFIKLRTYVFILNTLDGGTEQNVFT